MESNRPAAGTDGAELGGAGGPDRVWTLYQQELRRAQDLDAEMRLLQKSAHQLQAYTTDLQETYRESRQLLDQMQALHRTSLYVGLQFDPDSILDEALHLLEALVPAIASAAYALDGDVRGATRRVQRGVPLLDLPESVIPGKGPIGFALMADNREPLEAGDGTWLTVPLRTNTQALGALVLVRAHGQSFSGRERELVAMVADMATIGLQNALAYRSVEEQAMSDGLTGLYNYRYFRQQLGLEVARAQRLRYSLGLLMADVDHFKQVNDRFGHPAGDRTLRAAAQAMQQVLRRSDVLSRVGGEEFAVILPACDLPQVQLVGDKLREAIAALPSVSDDGQPQIKVTLSVGGTATHGGRDDGDELVRRADAALLAAKRHGRNCTVIFGTETTVRPDIGGESVPDDSIVRDR